ncbi:hypothetical protein NL108_011011 [Boleophthalmus pectinirostris]|nr:hypothetical protein NL108_011011 [Boleophthalmus pectinirostris]
MDCALLSDETTVFTPNRHADSHIKLPSSDSTSAQDGAERCGSLHLSCSPESWGSERVGHWGLGCGEGAELLYGHYHGYGDTAEELTVYTQPDHVAMTT